MENEKEKKSWGSSVGGKFATIRLRTWTITISLLITLILTSLVNLATKQSMNPIDFMLMCIAQILVHAAYFPDGDLYGQKGTAFKSNKAAYNEKATKVNQERKIGRLREYCKVDYEERKERYILNECGFLEITRDELEQLRKYTEKEIRDMKYFEFKYSDGTSKLIYFPKSKRRRLFNLLLKPLPVEPNHAETIMSAVENNGNSAIHDSSVAFKRRAYAMKIFQAVVLGAIFAYIGYTLRDGIGLTEIVNLVMYLTAIFSTAVMAFTNGEICSKVYKSHFYVELVNFIDSFNEWDNRTAKDTATLVEPQTQEEPTLIEPQEESKQKESE